MMANRELPNLSLRSTNFNKGLNEGIRIVSLCPIGLLFAFRNLTLVLLLDYCKLTVDFN